MKVIFFTLLITLGSASVNAQSTSNSPICKKKEAQYGDRFVSCSEVDWGITPLSASYQPPNFGHMTAAPSEIKDFQNDYPGILNTEHYFKDSFYPTKPEKKGLSVASKVYKLLNPQGSSKIWMVSWYEGLQPLTKETTATSWVGSCDIWSAWSMDPKIHAAFSTINKGIVCNGIPFTKGELKEILTTLYPRPVFNSKHFLKFYKGYMGGAANPDRVEDANVALTKLGMLGQGDLGPAQMIQQAADAKLSGKNMMMDQDPGWQNWNHPIKKITDVTYTDESLNEWQMLSSAEFVAASGSSEPFLNMLRAVESDLTQNLVQANGVKSDQLCALRTKLQENCDGLNDLTLSAQVDELNRLKQSAYQKKMIQTKQPFSFLKHELIIEYGMENRYASNEKDHTVVQSYIYSTVNSVNADGSDGPVVRSQWSPPVTSLSQICANQSLAEGRNSTSITAGFQVSEKCAQGKVVDPKLAKREYFTGAVPPNSIRTFKAEPQFTPEQAEQKKAYDQFMDFMAKCDRFDAAVDFQQHLYDASLDNSFSSAETASLNKEYLTVKNLLDPSYAQSLLDGKYKGVQGVGTLKFH